MSPATIPTRLRRRIAAQAGHRCGYRRTSERLTGIRLTVDHIVPLAAGGATEEHNLWLACRACNEFKGTRTRAQDPDTGDAVELFNPRQQVWREHFAWSEDGTLIVGLTPVARNSGSA